MKRGTDRPAVIVSVCCVMLLAICVVHGQSHPFLLVSELEYPALQARAATSPWLEMKASAIHTADTLSYDHSLPTNKERCTRYNEVINATMLAYVLDPANKSAYVTKLTQTLDYIDDLISIGGADWEKHVRVGSTVFYSTLALDLIYDDIPSSQRSNYEYVVEQQVNATTTGAWETSGYAIKGTWALYRNDRGQIDANKNSYRSVLEGLYLTDNGIFNGGTGYSFSRFSDIAREQKFMFMDILEHTGEMSWYNHPQMVQFYEWLYGHVNAPHGRGTTFGDTSADSDRTEKLIYCAAPYRAHRFSQQAARHAAWWVRDYEPGNRFCTYIVSVRPTHTLDSVEQ